MWLVFASLLAFPLSCAVSVVGGWFAYATRAGTRARRVLSLLPLASLAFVVVAMALWK